VEITELKSKMDSIEKAIGGGGNGYAEGFEAGKKAENDAFWDGAQKNGTEPVYYGYLFCNRDVWTQERIEKVKYKHFIAQYFAVVFNGNTSITDLSMFTMESYKYDDGGHAKFSLSACFSGCSNLVKCMPLNFDFVSGAPNAFNGCAALEELPISGTIKVGDLNLKDSPKLSKASITSIINALSTTTSGLTVTLSKTAKEAAFTDAEWETLKNTRSNWNIDLV
jgi:hypothetical protein